MMKIKKFFRKEPYPSFPQEWDNPDNTLFREFYLTCSPDFQLLYELVKTHMSDKGNEGITRYRLMKILYDCHCREAYLLHRRRKYPHTWRLRWKLRNVRLHFHRKLRTRYFRNQLELCKIANEVISKIKIENP